MNSKILSKKEILSFQGIVFQVYQNLGRTFPWRETTNPYRILVSEFMLQQTQTSRVEQKYPQFIEKYSSMCALAQASTKDLLTSWQGLGYNRRALNLHETAKIINTKYNNEIPQKEELLLELPGIGPYTASAIRTFAFNIPTVMIETNIRTVYIHHFFSKRNAISDKTLIPYIEATIDTSNPREWYYALMDYGGHLKKKVGNLNAKSKMYTRQSKFEGSNRQKRGKIVRILTEETLVLKEKLVSELQISQKDLDQILKKLSEEGFLTEEDGTVYISE